MKRETLSVAELENRLLTLNRLGIKKVGVQLDLPEEMRQEVAKILETQLETSSDDSIDLSEDQNQLGRHVSQIKCNKREVLGVIKYFSDEIADLEAKHSGKIILTSTGAKLYANTSQQLGNLHQDFLQQILIHIRSYPVEKSGLELFCSKKAIDSLGPVKIIKYSDVKYCYFFSIKSIEENVAISKISQVQNKLERRFVPFILRFPVGIVARRSFNHAYALKMQTLINARKDPNTQVSVFRDGFILQEKNVGYMKELQEIYEKQLHTDTLIFVCLMKNVQDMREKMTKLRNVSKYIQVDFDEQEEGEEVEVWKRRDRRTVTMLINTQHLEAILSEEKARKTFGNFLLQLYTVNEDSPYDLGFFFPKEEGNGAMLKQKFQAELLQKFVFNSMTGRSAFQGVTFYKPKLADQNIHLLYLEALGFAVKRRKGSQVQLVTSNESLNQSSLNASIITETTVLNNTTIIMPPEQVSVFVPVSVNQLEFTYSVNFNLEPPIFKELDNHYARAAKDSVIEERLNQLTREYYKANKIFLNHSFESYSKEMKVKATCVIKAVDISNPNPFFFKIRHGFKIQKGLLVQVDTSGMDEKEDGFKAPFNPNPSDKAMFYATHEIRLLE